MVARLHRPQNWRAWREAAPFGAVGGSDVARLLMPDAFKTRLTQDHADQGHALEPLILARLHAFLAAIGVPLPPFEQGWVAEREEDPRDRGSLDGLAHLDGRPLALGEAKAVFLGQRNRWRPGSEYARKDGLYRYVEAQGLWYADILGVPVHVGALFLPCFDLGDLPAEAAIHLGELRVWTIHPDHTVEERAAVRDCVAAWREAGCPELGPTQHQMAPAPAPKAIAGTLEDGLLLARFELAHAEAEDHAEAARAAREQLAELRDEIRARVGDQRAIVAGGRIATVDKRGTVRVRREGAEGRR